MVEIEYFLVVPYAEIEWAIPEYYLFMCIVFAETERESIIAIFWQYVNPILGSLGTIWSKLKFNSPQLHYMMSFLYTSK